MSFVKWTIAILGVAIFIGWLTPTIIEKLINVLVNIEFSNADENFKLLNEYDFIVVGAGTAGCVVASRLSENPNWNVLLIEAGPDETTIMDIPAFVHFLQTSDKLNWKYQTEPSDEHCLAMNNHQCNWPRGKVMGGSSVLNYMIYTRGNRLDFDGWAEMGADGWSFKEIEKYFKKLENATMVPDDQESVHGQNGPVPVSYVDYKSKVSHSFVEGMEELGLPQRDYNGKEQISVSYVKTTTKNGYRISSNRAYIDPVKHRPNLLIKRKSFVTKIEIDPKTKTATGVTFTQNNIQFTVRAQKEVIISGGAINSPQLLMLSGIGPAEHLSDKGIEPIADLPVGQNLMDHYTGGDILYKVDSGTVFEDVESLESFLSYYRNGSGPLGSTGGCEAIAFFDTEQFLKQDGYPDVEMVLVTGAVYEAEDGPNILNLNPQIAEEMYGNLKRARQRAFMISIFLTRPKSRGSIKLHTNNPYEHPKIYANYFSHPDDVQRMIRGVRQVLKLENTEAFRKINAKLHRYNLKNCNHLKYDSDAYWECYGRNLVGTYYHYSGTCKMGADTDPTAVVNEKLQVKGVKKLRVADASIMPQIISGHPNAAIFMIGEKVSDMIKDYWNNK